MNISLKAGYEHGVFRLLEPVRFEEHQQVTVTIIEKPEISTANKNESCYDIALRTGIIGMIEEAPIDLSRNPKYYEGFGNQ